MIDQLIYSLNLAAPPDVVWAAITDPAHTCCYFYDLAVHAEWKKGGHIAYQLPNGAPALAGRILEYAPPYRFRMSAVLQFAHQLRAEQGSAIDWVTTPRGSGTLLIITHDGLAECPRTRRIMRTSWPAICDALARHVAVDALAQAQCSVIRTRTGNHPTPRACRLMYSDRPSS
ncbi:MAG TPA: SRPBCC domain-containing protein [Gemmatimonadaceae bacterium]|jgi:uncharacterized protein YndB with AHSA1/START domain|nr:SRPBCC domain-containing protein [Gemmatimonadaceae bacterium]